MIYRYLISPIFNCLINIISSKNINRTYFLTISSKYKGFKTNRGKFNLKDIKIAFTGLDNAGKTSFLIALRRKYNFYELVKELLPTKLIEFNAFRLMNYSINIWDMGGQEKYRQLYVKNLVYFEQTDFLYYIIDIQDKERFETSLQYLKKILTIYKDMGYSNEVHVCFHKFDPKIRYDEDYITLSNSLKTQIIQQNSDMEFVFFNTTYYDLSSLSRALSYSLNKVLNLNEIVSYVENLGKKYECGYISLYTDSGLILADYYHNMIDSRDFEERISSKINDDLEFFQSLEDNHSDFTERTSFFDNQKEFVKKYDIETAGGDTTLFLGLASDKLEHFEVKKKFKEFHELLEKTFK